MVLFVLFRPTENNKDFTEFAHTQLNSLNYSG